MKRPKKTQKELEEEYDPDKLLDEFGDIPETLGWIE